MAKFQREILTGNYILECKSQEKFMMTLEKQIDAGDIKLTYYESGNEQAPTLVFVHSLFTSAKDWKDITNAFENNFRVITLNLRGHSTSEWKGNYTFEKMAEDLKNFLDALHIEKTICIGHSLGGIVSYFFAATYPDRVVKLILEEAPPPKPVDKPFNFGSKPNKKLPYDWNAIVSVVDQLNKAKPEWWAIAKNITAPTLVIGGGKSSHVPQEWNTELAQLIPNAKHVLLKGGHFVHSKHPRLFIDVVNNFLFDKI